MIDLCTFTGIDAKTDLVRVADMAAEYPFAEFGVLLSRTTQDKDSRYPSFADIERIVGTLSGKARLAVHVCGRAVGEFVGGASDIEALVEAGVGRMQLNFILPRSGFSMEELDLAISRTAVPVITQNFPSNSALAAGLLSQNHQVLYDTSGGRGVVAKTYASPLEGKYTGYAGGIGPENVLEVAEHVIDVSGGRRVWIDMENRVRTGDYFDLDKCAAVAAAVSAVVGLEVIERPETDLSRISTPSR